MGRIYYTKEEVEKIIQRVITAKGFVGERFSKEDILAIAKELNLDTNLVLAEIEKSDEDYEFEQAKIIWLEKRKKEFYQFASFVGITFIALFITFAFLVPDGLPIAIMLLAIGIAIEVIAYVDAFHPSEEKIERGARKLIRSKKWKKKFDSLLDSLLDFIPDKTKKS